MEKSDIDHGRTFDWGRTSADYARFRDIYPPEFFGKLLELGIGVRGQNVLDLGTGTGVLPRHLYPHGARFVGVDIAAGQIAEARRLSAEAGMDITYQVSAAEDAVFPDDAFDAVTACQCYIYFDPGRLAPKLKRWLKPGGRIAICSMNWWEEASGIARQSEEMVLRFNPGWTGGKIKRKPREKPEWAEGHGFAVAHSLLFDVSLPFTRESWNGRMKACRGVGASLPLSEIERFDREHRALLERIAPAAFVIPHYITIMVLENHR